MTALTHTEHFAVEHMTFVLRPVAEGGATFAILPTEAAKSSDRKKVLFSGGVSLAMPDELRKLADRVEEVLS